MKQYAVIHVEKCKSNVGALGNHLDRKKIPENAFPGMVSQNREIVSHSGNLNQAVDNRLNEGYEGKTAIRKDAVKSISIVLTGTHDQMKHLLHEGYLPAWIEENKKFLFEKYGERNIVSMHLHMDERTPHIHAVVVPLTPDGRLSAKEVVGNRDKLRELQDDYAEKMERLGLARGEKYSRAKHEDVKEYYKRVNTPTPTEYILDSPFLESKQKAIERFQTEIAQPLLDKYAELYTQFKVLEKRTEKTGGMQKKLDARKRLLIDIAVGKVTPKELEKELLAKEWFKYATPEVKTPGQKIDQDKLKQTRNNLGL